MELDDRAVRHAHALLQVRAADRDAVRRQELVLAVAQRYARLANACVTDEHYLGLGEALLRLYVLGAHGESIRLSREERGLRFAGLGFLTPHFIMIFFKIA